MHEVVDVDPRDEPQVVVESEYGYCKHCLRGDQAGRPHACANELGVSGRSVATMAVLELAVVNAVRVNNRNP